jgi:carboxyl-terminal processing protease
MRSSLKSISILTVLALVFLSNVANGQANPKEKFDAFLQMLHKSYVDTVNDDELVDVAITSILKHLDPHSKYYNSKLRFSDKKQSMSGAFSGIGIEFSMEKDTVCVTQIISDGPAEIAGLMAGDRIISIDNENVAGKKFENFEILKKIRGQRKTEIELVVVRSGRAIPFHIVRDYIPDHSIKAFYMVNDSIGYISLGIFNKTTRQEMDSAIISLNKKGMKNLILDLQSNGGGYVESALGVADEFMKRDQLVYYSVSGDGGKDYYYAAGSGHFQKGRVVVLIDQSTASASEIFTGALQDWDRAVVVGRRSFGKGLMQRPIPLFDGSVVELTGSRYYTPTGRSLQKPYKNTDYFSEVQNRFKTGEMINPKNIPTSDSLKYQTLINKRTVYGGGGIIPDVYVPVDLFEYGDWVKNVMGTDIVGKYSFDYVDQHRIELKKAYATIESFMQQYKIPAKLIAKMITEAEIQGIYLKKEEKKNAVRFLSLEFKAQVASQLFSGNKSYQRVINESNQSFIKACGILSNNVLYNELIKSDHNF